MVGQLTQNFLQKDALERRALELWDDHGQRPHSGPRPSRASQVTRVAGRGLYAGGEVAFQVVRQKAGMTQ
jgi:hypothetical protein